MLNLFRYFATEKKRQTRPIDNIDRNIARLHFPYLINKGIHLILSCRMRLLESIAIKNYQNTRLTYISDKSGSSSLLSFTATRRTGVQLVTYSPAPATGGGHVLQYVIVVKPEDSYRACR